MASNAEAARHAPWCPVAYVWDAIVPDDCACEPTQPEPDEEEQS